MHPLTTFPQLLFLGLISPTILRLVVSLFVIYLGYKRSKKEYNWSSIFYVVAGVLVLLGLYTQIAVIVGIIVLKFDFYIDYFRNRKTKPVSINEYILYAFAGIILLSLIFTGPGLFAFDLPL